jgi:hypothetical protein
VSGVQEIGPGWRNALTYLDACRCCLIFVDLDDVNLSYR